MFKFYKALTFFLSRIILVLPFFATAQNPAENQQLMHFMEVFNNRTISGQSISLELKNNEIDLSHFIEMINSLKESDYAEDLLYMEITIDVSIRKEIDLLCEKSLSKDNCIKKAKDSLENAFLKIVKEKENQILYPEDYSKIYGRSKAENNRMIESANTRLDFECPSDTDERVLSSIIRTLHPNRWDELQDKLKYTDKNFLKKLVQRVYADLEQQEYPEQCLDLANKNHRVCKRVTKELTIKTQRFTYLTELVYGQDILKTTEAKAPCVDCLDGSLPKELSTLDQLFSRLKEHSLCSDPAPGEEKQITSNFLGYSHTVRRESDGSFSIPLNLAFSADEDYDGEVPKDQVPAHYKNKVQECLKKANSKMLGPNGEKLNIVIEPPSAKEICKEEKPKTIKIGSSKHRSHSGKYESDINCPLITHEILHLLGLCDEYKEKITGFQVSADTGEVKKVNRYEKSDNSNDKFVLAYDCRVTSQNSIMSNHNERWENVFEFGKNNSLLKPEQFNRILYGDCPSKNKLFNECADLAYRSTVKEGNEDCLKQKRKCMENNVMGKNKAEELSRIRKEIKSIEGDKELMLMFLQQMIDENKPQSEIAQYENKIQEYADSALQKLREELEMVSAWPD